MPERVVQVGYGFKVLWLEEIRPQNEEFVLAVLGLFFLDECVSSHGVHVGCHRSAVAGVWAFHSKHFFGHGLDGLGSDSGAGWGVHTARSVTVGFGNDGGLHVSAEDAEP